MQLPSPQHRRPADRARGDGRRRSPCSPRSARSSPCAGALPAVQAAAVAATGFVAGAATVAVDPPPRGARKALRRRAARARRGGGAAADRRARARSWSTCTCSAASDRARGRRSEPSCASRSRPAWPFRLPRAAGSTACCACRGGVLHRLVHRRRTSRSLVRVAQTARATACCSARGRASRAAAERAIERMRFALGVDDDLRAVPRALPLRPADRARRARRPGAARCARRPEPFEALAWAICEQLIEFVRAAAIERRIVLRGSAAAAPRPACATCRRAATLAAQAPALLESFDLAAERALALVRAAREVASGPRRPRTPPTTSAAGGGCARSRRSARWTRRDARAARARAARPAARRRPRPTSSSSAACAPATRAPAPTSRTCAPSSPAMRRGRASPAPTRCARAAPELKAVAAAA